MKPVETREEERKPVKNGRKVKVWVAAILSVIVIVLVIQNKNPVNVRLLFWSFPVSGVILFLFLFLVGLVVGYVLRGKLGKS